MKKRSVGTYYHIRMDASEVERIEAVRKKMAIQPSISALVRAVIKAGITELESGRLK